MENVLRWALPGADWRWWHRHSASIERNVKVGRKSSSLRVPIQVLGSGQLRGLCQVFPGQTWVFLCFRKGLCPLEGTQQQAGDVFRELRAAGRLWADASAIGGALWPWLSFCSGLGCFRPSTCSTVLRVALPGTPGIQQLEPHGRETLVGAPLLDTAPDVELSLP